MSQYSTTVQYDIICLINNKTIVCDIIHHHTIHIYLTLNITFVATVMLDLTVTHAYALSGVYPFEMTSCQ